MENVRTLPVGEQMQGITATLDDLAREGARRMIAAALEAEVSDYVDQFAEDRDEEGKRLVVRNGRAKERGLTLGSGTVRIKAPRVNDRRIDEETGERERFSSQNPAEVRPALAEGHRGAAAPLPARALDRRLRARPRGSARQGRSGAIAQLDPAADRELGRQSTPSSVVASFASTATPTGSSTASTSRSASARTIGSACSWSSESARTASRSSLAVEDGYRESTESWSAVMRDLKERGINEPKLVVGDGALGIWAALRDVFPHARRQACWVHAIANVLDVLPKRLQSRAKTMLHEIMEAPTRSEAGHARQRFREEFDAKYPKAIAKLDRDWQHLTAFYDFPAEHWRHLRTSNAIESSFATVKLRTRVTKGAGSKKAALAMAYKLLDALQVRWRRFNGHELVADVLEGVKFKDGIRVTDDETTTTDERVAA